MKTTAETIDRDSLCDIRDVHINPSLPKEQRIHEFLQQIPEHDQLQEVDAL